MTDIAAPQKCAQIQGKNFRSPEDLRSNGLYFGENAGEWAENPGISGTQLIG
jgi:hypothetical protein